MVTFQGGFCVTPMCDILFCFYYIAIFCAGGSTFALFRTIFAASFIESMCFINVT